jgi:hypothetical protein
MFRLLFYRLAQVENSILLDDRHIQSSFSFNSKSSIVLIIDKILQNTELPDRLYIDHNIK